MKLYIQTWARHGFTMEHATAVASAVTIYILITDFGLRTRKEYILYI